MGLQNNTARMVKHWLDARLLRPSSPINTAVFSKPNCAPHPQPLSPSTGRGEQDASREAAVDYDRLDQPRSREK